jgi:hypothetical protein
MTREKIFKSRNDIQRWNISLIGDIGVWGVLLVKR